MHEAASLVRPQASQRRSGLGRLWLQVRQHKFVYLAGVALPLLLFSVFVGFPILSTIYLSFLNWDGIGTTVTFAGVQNYLALLDDATFRLALRNTAVWTVLTLLVPVVIGFFLAILLTSSRLYFQGLIRSLFFLPSTMSLVTVGIMFALVLNPIFGAANAALKGVGLGFLVQDWLGNPKISLYTLILTYAWTYMGLPLTMFYAGIRQVPVELYEAAQIEGAGFWQTLRYVTLPMLRPVLTVVTVISVINSVKAFDLVFAMTRGGPYNRTVVLGYFMYVQAFLSYRYGYGSAISVVILIISSVFAYVYLRRIAGESLRGSN